METMFKIVKVLEFRYSNYMKIKKTHGETSFRQELRLTVELLTKWPLKISNGNLSRKKDAHWRHFVFHINRFRFKAVAERRQ